MALSTIKTASIANDAVTTDKIVNDGNLGSRSILINGAMKVHQRGNTTTTNGASVYFVDRFNVYHNSSAAVANLQQATDTPTGQGFSNSLLIDVTTADTSIAAGEIAVLRQILEGQNLQQLKYGSSNAESITLSFWVKSPKTGVHICELYHLATGTSKTQSQSYTISSANTWEKHSVTFSGDTATALDNDNAYTIAVQWGLFAGTDYNGSTLQTTWANLSDQTKRFAGQVNLFDNTSNNFYLTGVQLEVGVETPFEHEDYSTTLAKCQRYYQEYITYKLYFNGTNEPSSEIGNSRLLPVVMRAVPTVGNKTSTHGSVGAYSANTHSIRYLTVSSHGSGGFDVGFDLDAEL